MLKHVSEEQELIRALGTEALVCVIFIFSF